MSTLEETQYYVLLTIVVLLVFYLITGEGDIVSEGRQPMFF